MKIQLLIAASESDYSEYLSNVMSAKYAETFTIGLCSSKEKLGDVLAAKKYDAILVESDWLSELAPKSVKLALALWSDESADSGQQEGVIRVSKYQRISSLVSDILEHYSSIVSGFSDINKGRGKIVAVWSPTGGVGKTTAALAYATRGVSQGAAVTYLDMEHFSSTGAYFAGEGKSISALFEKLSSTSDILVKSIRQHDNGSGVDYFAPPVNYDDINELTKDDMVQLVSTCAMTCDMLVIDLPGICDKRIHAILELADVILLVSDGSRTAMAKLDIFVSQHSVFADTRHKIKLVLNNGAKAADARFGSAVNLPRVQTGDPVSVFKTLSGINFDV